MVDAFSPTVLHTCAFCVRRKLHPRLTSYLKQLALSCRVPSCLKKRHDSQPDATSRTTEWDVQSKPRCWSFFACTLRGLDSPISLPEDEGTGGSFAAHNFMCCGPVGFCLERGLGVWGIDPEIAVISACVAARTELPCSCIDIPMRCAMEDHFTVSLLNTIYYLITCACRC